MRSGRRHLRVHYRLLAVHHSILVVDLLLEMVHRYILLSRVWMWGEVAMLSVFRVWFGVVIEERCLTHGLGMH